MMDTPNLPPYSSPAPQHPQTAYYPQQQQGVAQQGQQAYPQPVHQQSFGTQGQQHEYAGQQQQWQQQQDPRFSYAAPAGQHQYAAVAPPASVQQQQSYGYGVPQQAQHSGMVYQQPQLVHSTSQPMMFSGHTTGVISQQPMAGNAQQPSTYTSAIPIATLHEFPAVVDCPACGQRGMTNAVYETGNCTHLWALGACCVTGCLCFIPYLVNNCKDVIHKCSKCGVTLAKYKRSGGTIPAMNQTSYTDSKPGMSSTVMSPVPIAAKYANPVPPPVQQRPSAGSTVFMPSPAPAAEAPAPVAAHTESSPEHGVVSPLSQPSPGMGTMQPDEKAAEPGIAPVEIGSSEAPGAQHAPVAAGREHAGGQNAVTPAAAPAELASPVATAPATHTNV